MHQKRTAGLCHENNQLTEADLKEKKKVEYKVNRRKTALGLELLGAAFMNIQLCSFPEPGSITQDNPNLGQSIMDGAALK